MFNFTTLSVYNAINTSGENKNLWVSSNSKVPALRIGNTRFDKAKIVDIQIKQPTPEALASVEFDMNDIKLDVSGTINEITARIAVYVNLSMNSQDSYYANDFVYKGKPFFIEFYVKKADSADDIAKRVVANAKKYLLLQSDTKLLTVTESSGKVTITGTNGYQQITKAALQKFNPDAIRVDCCTNQGEFEDVIIGVPAVYTVSNVGVVSLATDNDEYLKLSSDGTKVALAANEVPISPGLEAFGDYNWIIHNLRLPTAANTGFWSPTKEEMPAVGQEYVQFIVTMTSQRNGIAGEAVGMQVQSVTTHVLYVAKGASATAVQNAFTTLLGADAATKIKTDADTALQTPFGA